MVGRGGCSLIRASQLGVGQVNEARHCYLNSWAHHGNSDAMRESYECDQCGACCQGHLIVEAYDIDVMREQDLATAAIGRPKGQTYDQLMSDLEQEGRCVVIAGSQPCKFLTDSFRCAIYPTRPNVCVAMKAGSGQCQQARTDAGIEPLPPR